MNLDSLEIFKFMMDGFFPLIKVFLNSSLFLWVILPVIIASFIFRSNEARGLISILAVVVFVALGSN